MPIVRARNQVSPSLNLQPPGCSLIHALLQRYLLPIAIILTVAISRWTFPLQYSPSPVTEHHLQNTIADLITIHSLLPSSPSIPPLTTRPESILRILSIIYIPYLLVTHLVAIPTLIAIAGTFVFTHRAPWASTARRILWSSAHIRWGLYQAYAFLSGDPLPVAYQQMSNLHPPKSSGIRFLFTIYENQRWWMGLDWVPALLPAERPSWCSADLQPVSPPHAFTLPPETSVVMSDGKGGKVKRTAQWDWVDFEWRVVVKMDGERPAVLLEHTLLKEEMKEKDVHSSPKVAESGSKSALASPSNEVQEEWENIVDHDHVTDSDGWVYGDNKWEHPGNKGGIGKVRNLLQRSHTDTIVCSSTRAIAAGRGLQCSLSSSTTSLHQTCHYLETRRASLRTKLHRRRKNVLLLPMQGIQRPVQPPSPSQTTRPEKLIKATRETDFIRDRKILILQTKR